MQRLGIFVFFDQEGIVDRYIYLLLASLKKICTQICIVINGKIHQKYINELYEYAEWIFIRENVGYDAGAYKDVFINLISINEWSFYDEIILLNDSMFGPLYSLEKIMDQFTNENADFWGITYHPNKKLYNGKIIDEHIQAYFLIIRKRIICSPLFLKFWKNMKYPKNYEEAVYNFEIKFTVFFTENGFTGKTLMDDWDLFYNITENPYLYFGYELIKDVGSPFLKKKALAFENPGYVNSMNALEYIEKELNYNITLIWENILRLSKQGYFTSIFNYYKLECFYNEHERVYIYGAGKIGKKMEKYFQCRKWRYESFLVTQHESEAKEKNIKVFECVDFYSTDGIILALGRTSIYEVYQKIKKRLGNNQLFLPEYYN